jgi:hypothetical protein
VVSSAQFLMSREETRVERKGAPPASTLEFISGLFPTQTNNIDKRADLVQPVKKHEEEQ